MAYDRFAEEASPEGMSHTELTARLRTDLAALDASVLPEEEQEAFQLIQKNAEEFEAVLAVALAAGEDVDKPPLQWQDPELGRKLMDLMGDMMMGILDLGVEIQGESFLD